MLFIKEIKKIQKNIKKYYNINIKKDEFMINCYRWVKDKGDSTLRLDYPLNENSLVFDVGGYIGEFAAQIFCKYQCNIYIFEPIRNFYENCKKRFSHNNKVKVFDFGLSDHSFKTNISVNGTSTSLYKNTSNNTEKIELFSIIDFIKENNIKKIDLIKINIEGGEYPLLSTLIDNELIDIANFYQIQFHKFILEAIEKREMIRKKLKQKYNLIWDYPFVWESWRRKQILKGVSTNL